MKNRYFAWLLLLAVTFSGIPEVKAAGESNFTNIVASEDLKFRTNLIAEGRYGSSVLTLESSSTPIEAAQLAYSVILKRIGGAGGLDGIGVGTELANGTPNQVLTLMAIYREGSGTWVVTPDTATGFTKLTFDADSEYATLLYVNDTVGWVIRGTSATVTTTD